MLELGHNDSDNDHAAEHDDGSDDEHRLATDLVDDQLWGKVLVGPLTRVSKLNIPWQGRWKQGTQHQ